MENIRDMLTIHEGWKNKPYRDTKGILTIGVGWNIEANKLPDDIAIYLRNNGQITDDMVSRLLDISIETATNNCRDIFKDFDTFSEARRFALIDWMFNCGIGTILKFKKALAAINSQDWETVANEMKDSAWYREVGNRAVEVCKMIKEG